MKLKILIAISMLSLSAFAEGSCLSQETVSYSDIDSVILNMDSCSLAELLALEEVAELHLATTKKGSEADNPLDAALRTSELANAKASLALIRIEMGKQKKPNRLIRHNPFPTP